PSDNGKSSGEDVPRLEVVALHHEDRIGKQHADNDAVRNEVPFCLRHTAQCLDRPPRADDPQIPAKRIECGEIGVDQRMNGLLVKSAQVIALEKRVDHDLPVYTPVEHARFVVVVRFEPIGGKIVLDAAERGVEIETCAWRRAEPDHAAFLYYRQLAQPALALVDLGERALVRARQQPPVGAITPGVIRTGEATLRLATAFGDARAAVTADIEERAKRTILVPYQQNGIARIIMSHIV